MNIKAQLLLPVTELHIAIINSSVWGISHDRYYHLYNYEAEVHVVSEENNIGNMNMVQICFLVSGN